MKYKAHVLIIEGYETAIHASQWVDELKQAAKDRFEEYQERAAVVTVEFEIDEDIAFPPEPPIPIVTGQVTEREAEHG